ncbi:NADH dehydrogenase (ubiquinone) complex I, assembly factor 6 [Copidosoma floridanum]|uniref:NADH dehydrogenase (ubiquinone) complex I, assembly factor 6 n=1 Tax=Copidosoma floridanum TaxID=29053 RepID=UPI0006C96A31|nr:NADH dehydrogenase (ubiquinone) complex I, assembly factor 6 [Copidosoma floridanum]
MNVCMVMLSKPCTLVRCCLRWSSTYKRQTPAEYCLNLVKKNDYESFLCTLLLPNNVRSSAFAIRAFNTEIALVEDQVKDDQIGLMRLKFWEETLNKTYDGKPPKNPTHLELHRVLQENKLSKHYFKRLIEARFNQLSNSIFINLESLEKYAENTVSSVYYLILEAQGTKDVHTDHYASHLGKAHGIVTLIRSVPYNAQKRKMVLPQDILMKHNVSSESIFQGKSTKELRDVVYDVSCRAKQHFDKALSMKKQIKKESRIIFLSSTIVGNYLEKLQRADFDIFDPKLSKRNNVLPLQLYWNKLLNK